MKHHRGQIYWLFGLSIMGLLLIIVAEDALNTTPIKPVLAQGSSDFTLTFSTYLGGSQEDTARDVTADNQGNIYITGGTASNNFSSQIGGCSGTFGGVHDVYVIKLSPTGSLIWCRLIGGPNYDRAYAIEVDNLGGVYIGGRAGANFPTTAGVLQPNFAGDVNPAQLYGAQDGFVAKLSANNGSVTWATYFGTDDKSFVRDIDIDNSGQVHLALTAVSRSVPYVQANAFQPNLAVAEDGVVAKLSADGTQVLWATYLGGSGQFDLETPSIRVDRATGNVYVLGGTDSNNLPTTAGPYGPLGGIRDLHLASFSATGGFRFGVYLGGSDVDFLETHELALDGQGNAIVSSTTLSSDFPTTVGAYDRTYNGSGNSGTGANSNYPGDVFVSKISSDGSQLLASTFIGGRYGEGAEGVSTDAQGNIYVSGATYSDNFPVTTNAHQLNSGGDADFFVAKFSADLSQLLYATYFGGSGTDYGRTSYADAAGNFYLAGMTQSDNWFTRNAFQASRGGGWDGALVKFGSISPANHAPYTPNNPKPANGAGNILPSQSLSWQGGDPDGDVVTYTVAFGPANPPQVVGLTTLTGYTPLLNKGATYYWRITATDGLSTSVGPLWSFTTTITQLLYYLPIIHG